MMVLFNDSNHNVIFQIEIDEQNISYNISIDSLNRLSGYLSINNITINYQSFLSLLEQIKNKQISYIKIINPNSNNIIIIPSEYIVSISYNYSIPNISIFFGILINDTDIDIYFQKINQLLQN